MNKRFRMIACSTLLTLVGMAPALWAQVLITSTTTPAYTVSLSISPVSLVNVTCGNGSFTYQTQLSYSLSFSSPSAPPLNYAFGSLYCKGGSGSYSLPVAGGTGTLNTGVATYTGSIACTNATPSLIGCS